MKTLVSFILEHSEYAPWITFGLILLAGLNVPISIDLIMILAAFLAATTLPHHTLSLYLSLLIGTYFSAWLAYWLGRLLGKRLLHIPLFSRLLPPKRLLKIEAFYHKHGFLTLLLGRFIPFGVRNCIFMTAGICHSPFGKFALRDLIPCSVWTTTCFSIFYTLGLNYQLLFQRVKIINLALFIALSVTVIAWVWYKKHKNKQTILKQ